MTVKYRNGLQKGLKKSSYAKTKRRELLNYHLGAQFCSCLVLTSQISKEILQYSAQGSSFPCAQWCCRLCCEQDGTTAANEKWKRDELLQSQGLKMCLV